MNGIISRRFKEILDDYSESNSIWFLRYTTWKGEKKQIYYHSYSPSSIPQRPTSSSFPSLYPNSEIEQLFFGTKTQTASQREGNEYNHIVETNNIFTNDYATATPSKRQKIVDTDATIKERGNIMLLG